MTALSPRETELLAYIKKSFQERRIAPTLTEMSIELNLSKSTVNEYLQRLIKKGYIVRQYGLNRGLIVTTQE